MNDFKNNSELSGFDSVEPITQPVEETAETVTATETVSEPITETAGETASYSYTPPVQEQPIQQQYDYMPSGQYNYQQPVAAPVQPKPQKAPKQKKAAKGFSFASVMCFVIIAAIVGAAGGVGGYIAADSSKAPSTTSNTSTVNNTGAAQTENININTTLDSVVEAVAKKCSPSVIGIRTTASVRSFFGNQESTGEGSGIIYSSDGYIITNYHVIEEAVQQSNGGGKVEVFLSDTTEEPIPATVVGYNISYDLAVIKVDATGLPAMELGDSDALAVGQYVVAIGNPGGLVFMGSISYGIISGLNRTLSDPSNTGTTCEYIQTDAAINPGNSGGALVNTKGQLLGVNSVKLVSEGYEGMGFAIPVNKVKEICDNIISKEYEPEPYIGVELSTTYDAETLQMHGYPVGAVIKQVVEGGPADTAGIRRGDIITKFNGVSITDFSMFPNTVAQSSAGETVEVEIYRDSEAITISLVIGSNG